MADLQRDMEKLAVDRLSTAMRRLHVAVDSIRAVKLDPSTDVEARILDILPPVADDNEGSISDRLLALVDALSEAIEETEALESTRSPPVNKSKPRAPLCLLSLRDYTGVQAAVELVLVWGAYPCVEAGILTPIHQRVVAKTFKIDRAVVQHVAAAASSRNPSAAHLDNVMKGLLHILQLSQFKPMLLPAYLADLLACLVFRIHCVPTPPPDAATGLLQRLLDALPIRVVMASLRGVLATPHANTVFKAQCGLLLSQCVLKDGGVLATIEMLLSTVDEGNTQARLQVAALIARCPRALSTTEYLHAIAPQVRWLLTQPTTKLLREVAGLIASQLILDHPVAIVDDCILRPLFLPLLRFVLPSESDGSTPADDSAISFVSAEAEIDACVAALKCMLLGPVPPAPVLEALVPLFRPLVYLDAFARSSKSYVHADTQQLLLLFAEQLPSAATHLASCVRSSPAELLRASLYVDHAVPATSPTTSDVVFCAGGSGGVGLRRGNGDNVIDNVIDAIVDMLGQPQLDENNVVVGELFSHLLTAYMQLKTNSPGLDKPDADTGGMRLLLRLTESLGPAVLRSGVVILQTLVTVLSMYTAADMSGDDEEEDLDVLSVGLSMATTIVQAGAATRSSDEEALLTKLLVPLEQLAAHSNAPIAEMASDLCLHIVSRSAAPDDAARTAATTFAEMMDRSTADLQSSQVPLRARGFARLTRWIRRRKPVDDIEALVQLCVHHLADSDSYVYLAAVQALAGLGDVHADKTIPWLLEAVQDTTRQYSIEQRIKLSEALLFTARRCGDLMPKYGRAFVYGYLGCIRRHPIATEAQDALDEATFRASCLSNLAEVCGLLHWAIHPYVTDVVACVRGILETERQATDAQIALRRGAVFVLFHMLQLMGRDILEAMPDAMTPIYRLLKVEAAVEKDPVCRFHAENSVKELDAIMRGELFSVSQAESRPAGLPSMIFLNKER